MGLKVALIFALAVSVALPLGTLAVAEGGPSTFGYDASSACSKPISRVSRARTLEKLPCDFRRENWCTIAGHAYPWQAVRRFVQENQGLMRRMYGDEKHISVLKTELDENDVELEIEGDRNQLYSEDASSLFPHYQDDDYDLQQNIATSSNREYLGRSMNSGSSSKLDKPKTEEASTRQHPNETPTASTTGHSTTSTGSTSTATTSIPPSITTSSSSPATARRTLSHRTKITLVTASSTSSSSPSPSTANTSTATESSARLSSTTPLESLAQIAKIQNVSINEIDRFDANVDELTEIPEETTLQSNVDEDLITPYSLPASSSSSSEPSYDFSEFGDKLDQDSAASEPQEQQQQFRPRPEYRPQDTKPEIAASSAVEAQLFQDAAAKDQQDAPVLKVRGINACPVKEEVVAPFWANNTRGEVLALLNLYPFEQYVHWEKCTHENKQMYCRDGCRCEQQYRLHRLLAYDPNNECRGIFSDWFKFPSCCICRCYDLPLEFRVTSRSPRLQQTPRKKRLKVHAPKAPPYRQWHN